MTTIRFTENQVTECGYDFSELGSDGVSRLMWVKCQTYWDSKADQLITKITLENPDPDEV